MPRHSLKLFALLILCMFMCTACSPIGNSAVRVKIRSIPVRIALAAGGATLSVLTEEFAGVKIDANDLLEQVFPSLDEKAGTPDDNNPVIMVVNKTTNNILYWRLTKNVKTMRIKHKEPGAIELKVINETPLRVELWIDGDIEKIDIDIDMKD